MKAVILAAEFGTALYPLTRNIPKALLPLGNKTVLDYLVEKLDRLPIIDQIIIVSNSRFYTDFVVWQKKMDYRKPIRIIQNGVYEAAKEHGSARDLNLALRAFRGTSENFLVFRGDCYFELSLGYFLHPCLGHDEVGFVGFRNGKVKSAAGGYGLLHMDGHGRISLFEDRPLEPTSTNVSIGIYYLPALYRLRLFEYLEIENRETASMAEFIAWLSKKEPLYGIEFHGVWTDLRTQGAYLVARKYVSNRLARRRQGVTLQK